MEKACGRGDQDELGIITNVTLYKNNNNGNNNNKTSEQRVSRGKGIFFFFLLTDMYIFLDAPWA